MCPGQLLLHTLNCVHLFSLKEPRIPSDSKSIPRNIPPLCSKVCRNVVDFKCRCSILDTPQNHINYRTANPGELWARGGGVMKFPLFDLVILENVHDHLIWSGEPLLWGGVVHNAVWSKRVQIFFRPLHTILILKGWIFAVRMLMPKKHHSASLRLWVGIVMSCQFCFVVDVFKVYFISTCQNWRDAEAVTV